MAEQETKHFPRPGEFFEGNPNKLETVAPDAAEPKMTTFAAAMIADGEWELAGFEPTEENYLAAYQHLVDTGVAWTLQGRIGREAARLIDAGEIEGGE